MWEYNYPDELYHYGRKGMKWYQNIFTKQREKNEARQRQRAEAEKYALIADSKNVTAKAQKGSTIMVPGKYGYTDTGRLYHPAYHVVDEYGDVKMSYINGVAGQRAVAAGKEYMDKHIDLSKHFYNPKDIDVEYGVYKDNHQTAKMKWDDAVSNYTPTTSKYGWPEDLRIEGLQVGSNKNVSVAISGNGVDHNTPASKQVMTERAAKAQKFVKNYKDDDVRESVSKEYFDNNTPWSNDPHNGGDPSTLTRKQFKEQMRLETISLGPDDNTFTAYYYDGGRSYGGHYFVAEGSTKDGKVRRISLEG